MKKSTLNVATMSNNEKRSLLSSRAENVAPSPTLAVDAKAKALKAAGEDVCGFGAGEPDFDTPDFIKEACVQALRDGKTKYCPSVGLPELREAIAQKYCSENKMTGTKANQVVVSPGGKFSCYLAIVATCNKGDEVIIPSPYWVSYPEMVKLADATPVFIHAGDDQGFKITPAQLEKAITPRSRMLIINSPSNPTGAVYTRSELEALAAVCLKHRIIILSDEIYEYLLYDGVEHASPASFSKEIADITITVSGFSKTFSMTGWRLGTLVAPIAIVKGIENLQSQTTSNATTFAQYGALAAMREPDKAKAAVAHMLTHFNRRRLILLDGLNAIKGVRCIRSEGAFYLFPNIESFGLKSSVFAERILDSQKVAVVPGDGFGAEGYMRLSYAVGDSVITKGLERLKYFCETL